MRFSLLITRASHVALRGIATNMLFRGTARRMGSAMVPLDRALLSSYRLSIVNIPLSVTVWLQFSMHILTGGSDPQIYPSRGRIWAPYNVTWNHRVSLPNGISFRPTALAGCTTVTDGQSDGLRYGNICRNRRNRFQRCRLLIRC